MGFKRLCDTSWTLLTACAFRSGLHVIVDFRRTPKSTSARRQFAFFNESSFDNIKGLEYENLALQIFVSLPCVINTSVGYCVLGKCCYVASNNSVI